MGLSLQGSLSNFAGGMLIIIFKPFKVRHYRSARCFATVSDIQIFVTKLVTRTTNGIYSEFYLMVTSLILWKI
jgi:small conductance mechanosensitive channel